ncbi:GNAT family N-acetyltransferase [Vibrio sp. SCSIO 43136]|uniref:GNAT family N-acetyltransferase n=1 Tax=Vibrio sp. SCSIO 43136 TaxID=2819101 RepID=UPI002075C853|nr:GNAT family N-acetyltransferase [Vibrio sp. SCSIO 43136]USD67176.1 GNAT family N-acetyltransferase [Vibrio sp. SCSIO 43136]
MEIVELDWKQTLPVRHEVLWPGMPEDFCYVVGDESATHFGAKVDGELVSVMSVFMDEEDSIARLRKFATLAPHRHQGHGSALMQHAMEYLDSHKITHRWCICRQSTLPFYLQHDFKLEDDPYVRGGITFHRVDMRLQF